MDQTLWDPKAIYVRSNCSSYNQSLLNYLQTDPDGPRDVEEHEGAQAHGVEGQVAHVVVLMVQSRLSSATTT